MKAYVIVPLEIEGDTPATERDAIKARTIGSAAVMFALNSCLPYRTDRGPFGEPVTVARAGFADCVLGEPPAKPSYIDRPLDFEEILRRVGDGTRLTATIALPLSSLIHHDIETLNDLADDSILPDDDRIVGGMDCIAYRVVGYIPGGKDDPGHVLVEVSGDVTLVGIDN